MWRERRKKAKHFACRLWLMISSDEFFALRFLTDKPPSNGGELSDITSCLFGRRLPPERGRKGLTRRQDEREGEEVRGKT